MEISKNGSTIEVELKNGVPRVIDYLGYPFNYGFVPRQSFQSMMVGMETQLI